MTLRGKIQQSLRLLTTASQQSSPLLINFSGGKDSLTCLLLALEVTDDVEAFYMDSGQDLPFTLDYVRKRCVEFGIPLHVSHPARDRIQHKTIPQDVCLLPDYIHWWGYFPTSAKRYCSIWLKHRPGRIYCRAHMHVFVQIELPGVEERVLTHTFE